MTRPYVTDEGHHILDCAIPPDTDLDELDGALNRVPGVLEHGLFIGMAERALLGTPEGGVEELTPIEWGLNGVPTPIRPHSMLRARPR